VRNALEGVANVHRPAENCGPTTTGVEKLQEWLEQHGERPWDVIHFNFGCENSPTFWSRQVHSCCAVALLRTLQLGDAAV
jgi:hypothetical protein